MVIQIHKSWMALIVLILVLAAVPMVSATGEQSWHLSNASYTGTVADDDTSHYRDHCMNRTGNATGTYMKLPNMTKKTAWWYAEYPAQSNGLTFGEGNWIVNIRHGPTDSCTIWADVCKVNDSTGEVTYLADGSVSPSETGDDTFVCHDNPNTNQTFNTSERLALRIYHNRPSKLQVHYYDVTAEKYSTLTSPSADPGYPIPEPLTIVLISTGLLMLAGYAYMDRRNR